ncbi:ABC transporter substrate-binding protein, partial [Saliniramus sp.]|uniref:ABC transporter substrate-binding protein n=1 Tax=Saliniramus sp. TaxID=2986772 RepID=UPI002CEF19AB
LALYRALYETLVGYGPRGFRPRLARNWQVSPDARIWRFRLRPGTVFHDGAPCDAHAVKLSLERMARPDKGYALGSPAVWRAYLGDADIHVEDTDSLTIRLGAPMADLLDILAQAFILSPAGLDALDAGTIAAAPGSGPFRLEEYGAGQLLLTRFAEYCGRRPTNEAIRVLAEPDRARRLDALMMGAVQAATDLDPQASMALAQHGATRVESLTPVAIIFMMNAARGPLRDPLTRRALSLAIDRGALLCDAAGGAGRVLPGIVSPLHFGAPQAPEHEEDPLQDPLHDPDQARALLAQAGHAGGLALTLDTPTRLPDEAEALSEGLRAQLSAFGISIETRSHGEREAYAHQVRRKEIGDLCVFDSSPLSTFRVLAEKLDQRVRGAWWQGYASRSVEAAIDAGRAEPDETRRAAHYGQAYRLMQADPPWLTLYNPTRITGLAGHHPAFRLPRDAVIDHAALPALPVATA